MAGLAPSVAARAIVGCVALCVAVAQAAPALPALIAFDLPAQPLHRALQSYDQRTSLSVFFPSELVEGKTSAAVSGLFTAQDALHRLLEGTGLVARAVEADAFVLAPAPAGNTDGAGAREGGAPSAVSAYGQRVQARVQEALCAAPHLALGTYRLALGIWVGGQGQVSRVRLLDTTGDAVRDAAVLALLRKLDIGQPPARTDPADRPYVLLVRPRTGEAPAACPLLH